MNRAPSEVPDEGVLIGTAVLWRGIVRVAPSSTPQVQQNRLDSGTSEPHARHVIAGSVYHARPAIKEAATRPRRSEPVNLPITESTMPVRRRTFRRLEAPGTSFASGRQESSCLCQLFG